LSEGDFSGAPMVRSSTTKDRSTRRRRARAKPPDAATETWTMALAGDRAAFNATISPHLRELFMAARRERRYRVAVGDFNADDLTTEELVGEVLLRAWRDRHRRPAELPIRVWLLALLFAVVKDIARREARIKGVPTVSLEENVPPEPIYDDDESFWEWYQPDELTRWEDVVGTPSMTPEQTFAANEEFTRSLDSVTREVFLLCELHRVSLPQAALALGLSVEEAARRLAEAQRRIDDASGRAS
jgi:RNA polymerase sigma-70 factor (ECF subfamily)